MVRTIAPLFALAILALAACSAEVKGPKAEITPPEIVIKSNAADAGEFCPPGQAKQGDCSDNRFCPPGQAGKGRC